MPFDAGHNAVSRPRVGITTEERAVQTTVLEADCVVVAREYAAAVWDAQGFPTILPLLSPRDAAAVAHHLDALLLTGGGDIEPALYGKDRHETTYDVMESRDGFELMLVRAMASLGKPILGICRGLQLINVAFGGSLHRDLAREPINHWCGHFEDAHEVEIAAGTRLDAIYESRRPRVNSFHHQALDAIGTGLAVAASSPDGSVEAVEIIDQDTWIVGVQWHPERPWRPASPHRRLFEAFVDSAVAVPVPASEGGAAWID